MAAEQKRAYYLPKKLLAAFDKECRREGLVRQRATAAGLWHFLQAPPDKRQAMFDNLAKFLGKGG